MFLHCLESASNAGWANAWVATYRRRGPCFGPPTWPGDHSSCDIHRVLTLCHDGASGSALGALGGSAGLISWRRPSGSWHRTWHVGKTAGCQARSLVRNPLRTSAIGRLGTPGTTPLHALSEPHWPYRRVKDSSSFTRRMSSVRSASRYFCGSNLRLVHSSTATRFCNSISVG